MLPPLYKTNTNRSSMPSLVEIENPEKTEQRELEIEIPRKLSLQSQMIVNVRPHYLKPNLRIPSSLLLVVAGGSSKKTMVTTTTNSSDSYTTIAERISFEREIKKSKFIAIAGPISNEESAHSFLSEVKDLRATHNCWAYKLGDQYRSNDDGEPSGTAGKPIYSAIASSGIDRVMVVVIRYFGGIKLGTGGLVRAYGGVTSECLKNAPTCLVKSKVLIGVEVPFDLLGVLYHQLQSFQVEDIEQDYDTDKDGITIINFKVDYDRVESLEDAVKANCSRQIVFSKR